MNAASFVLQQPSIHVLGWTLLHFLWQGALIAWIFAMVRLALRRRSANARYLAGCAALAVFLAAPVVTFSVLSQGPTAPYAVVNDAAPATTPRTATPPDPTVPPDASTVVSGPAAFEPPPPATSGTPVPVRIEPWLPWLVAAWFLGVFVLSVRLLLGWIHVRRLRTRGIAPLIEAWQRRFEQLCRRMAVSRPVRLLRSSLVEVPAVIGCLRPIVLVPGSALTGLTSAQLESVLAHELAHIRRHDYLVNLLQNVIETLLFYHPAVWWVSRCVREERENCCDDLAVTVSEEPAVYAEALASLEELRHITPRLALGADGSGLLSRVRRILGLPYGTRGFRPRLAGLIALLGVTVVLTAITLYTALQREPVYYGKPVSTWIGMLGTSYHQAAFDVLTTAGDEVLPYLETAIVARESWFSQNYRSTHEVLPGPLAGIVPEPRSRNFFQVRATAAELIPEVTSDPDLALPILMRPFDDEANSAAALRALAEFRSDAAPAVPKLIALLDDLSPQMRRSAAETLGRIGPGAVDAIPALVALVNDDDENVRSVAVSSLGTLAAQHNIRAIDIPANHAETAVSALVQAARSDDVSTRTSAIQSLGLFGEAANPAVPVIVEALNGNDAYLRERALMALACIGTYPPDLESTLNEIAENDDHPLQRRQAIVLLWKNDVDNPVLKENVIEFIRWPDRPTDNPRIGSTTTYLLTFMRSPPRYLIPVLEEVIENDLLGHARFAAMILINLTPERRAELVRHLEVNAARPMPVPLSSARQRIIEIFARNHFDSERIVPELLNLLGDEELAAEAVHGLIEAEPNGRPEYYLLPLLSDARPHVQIAALDALWVRGIIHHTGLAILPDLLQHPDDSIRVPAARHTISYVRSYPSQIPPGLRPALEVAAADPNEELRNLATRALDHIAADEPGS